VQAIRAFDLDGDGVPELVTGLSNGRLEVRNDDNGELIYKDGYSAGVAAIVSADYHLDGREEVIVCCEDGEVRGYLPAEEELAGNLMDVQVEDQTLSELHRRKQELVLETAHYDKAVESMKASGSEGANTADCIVPPETSMHAQLETSNEQLLLVLRTNNEAIIKAVVVFGENIFEDADSYVVHPKTAAECVSVPLAPKKDVATELTIKAAPPSASSPTPAPAPHSSLGRR
jgi:Bardet-Biedl syndrome 2 protein